MINLQMFTSIFVLLACLSPNWALADYYDPSGADASGQSSGGAAPGYHQDSSGSTGQTQSSQGQAGATQSGGQQTRIPSQQEYEGGARAVKEAREACVDRAKVANASCATMSLLGMDPQTAMMTENMLMQATMLISQMKSSSGNAAEQCKKQADLSKLMGLVSAAKGTACGMTQGKCTDACGEYADAVKEQVRILRNIPEMQRTPDQHNELMELEKNDRKSAREKLTTCEAYKANVAMMVMQSMQMGMNMIQNNQCAKVTSTGATPTPTPFAAATPIPLPPGGGDCSDPKVAAISMVCICQANPADKMCSSLVGKPNDPNGSSGGVAGGPGTPGKPFSPDVPLGGTPNSPEAGQAQMASGNRGEEGGGGGGGFGSGGGGGGMLGGGGEGGYGGSGIDKNVITGQSSGGGGGGGLSGGYGGGGGGGGSRGSGYGGGGGSGFNMKNFLPNKRDYKNRGLAGMTVKSTDGITGPMGPSLWEKVTNQYQIQKSKLIPE